MNPRWIQFFADIFILGGGKTRNEPGQKRKRETAEKSRELKHAEMDYEKNI